MPCILLRETPTAVLHPTLELWKKWPENNIVKFNIRKSLDGVKMPLDRQVDNVIKAVLPTKDWTR